MDTEYLKIILSEFNIETCDIEFQLISNGLINDTYLVKGKLDYILQRINSNVFPEVEKLQSNIELVTNKLKSPNYTSIEFLHTKNGSSLLKYNGQFWRLMSFVEKSETYNTTDSVEIAFEAGKIIGLFHKLLNGEDVNQYQETITNFHNLPTRLDEFKAAFSRASSELKNKTKSEISFVQSNASLFDKVYKSDLPLRVCHNDTKLNNILFRDGKALCLIDLDTIMKGYFLYDFGDAIRTIVNPAKEDEIKSAKIDFNLELFESFLEGIKSSGLKLSSSELESLSLGPALMPFLHGTRALTDYLQGNIYYKVAYPEQNLDRSRSLLHFSKLAIEKQDELKAIIDDTLK